MKAVSVLAHGGPEVLSYGDREPPEPGPGQLRIRVAVTSVNFADIKARAGAYGKRELPFVPGLDAAGVVDEVGEGVGAFAPGQRVAAYTLGGSYAEYALTTEQLCFYLSDKVPFEQGAGIGVLITAYNVLMLAGRFAEGESVLIHAGAGGVGSTLVQLARASGAARVFATVGSAAKAEVAHKLGADTVINYREQHFAEVVNKATGGAGVDLILDSVSGENAERGMGCLADFGRLVIYGHTGAGEARIGSKQLHKRNCGVIGYSSGGFRRARPDVIKRTGQKAVELLAEGKVKILLGERFKLKDAAKAQALVESRKSVGKVLLEP